MGFEVKPVRTKQEMKAFLELPYMLYETNCFWVPPLRSEEKKKFTPKKNPSLFHCDHQNFILLKNDQVVGRVCVFIHRQALEHWNEKAGSFCAYECIEDPMAAAMLYETVCQWLKERGMTILRGPWDFDTKEWGFMVKGFEIRPMFMAPYNPSYYNDQAESFGLRKVKDLLAFRVKNIKDYKFPDRFSKLTDRIAEKNNVILRPLNMKNLKRDIEIVLNMANISTSDNWGYVPVTDAEASAIAKEMKPVLDPELVMIAEVKGDPIGYLLAFPDMNVIIKDMKGRITPLGLLKLLSGKKNIRDYRVWALGIVPQYLRKAIDTLFYKKLYEVMSEKNPRQVEANYVLEDNMAMNNPILKLGFEEAKRYRVYEMALS